MKKYYVYLYLDPRKPGEFIYDDLVFNFEPFYVGKGTDKRMFYQMYESLAWKNNIRLNKIKKIKKEGLNPIIIKIYDEIEEDISLKLEIETIKKIGRKDLNLGPLLNLTDGGETGKGQIWTEEKKAKLSESLKTSVSFQKASRSEEKIKKVSESLKKFYEKNQSKKKGVLRTESEIEKIKETMSVVYKIKTPTEEFIEIRGTNQVLLFFDNLNNELGLKSRFRVSPYAILYGKGSKGYLLIGKTNDYREMNWTEEKKIKNSINNKKEKNKNSSEYSVLCPNGELIKLIGRENLQNFIKELNHKEDIKISFYTLIDKGEHKGYKLIERKKIYKC